MTDAHLTEALRLIQQAREHTSEQKLGITRHVWIQLEQARRQLGRAASHIEIAREALGEEDDQ